jgi:hypothetical protein
MIMQQSTNNEIARANMRFPIEKNRYFRCTGRLLECRIGQAVSERMRALGYRWGVKVWVNPSQQNGLDLQVWLGTRLIIVGEILNWWRKCWVSKKRLSNIIKNLTTRIPPDCFRLLVFANVANEEALLARLERMRPKYNIVAIKLGYQLLPKHFFNFFRTRNQAELRKIDSRETTKDIMEKVSRVLNPANLRILQIFDDQKSQSSENKGQKGTLRGGGAQLGSKQRVSYPNRRDNEKEYVKRRNTARVKAHQPFGAISIPQRQSTYLPLPTVTEKQD